MPDSTALSWVNEAIRRALSPYPEGLVIVTKVGALAELRDAGMIRHLGVSSVRLRLLALAQVQAIAPVVAVQNRYGVDFGRAIDDLLRVCGRQAIAFVPFFALAGTGREVGGAVDNDAVNAYARTHGATAAQVRIAWSRGPHVLATPGAGNLAHLAENVAAGAFVDQAELVALGLAQAGR